MFSSKRNVDRSAAESLIPEPRRLAPARSRPLFQRFVTAAMALLVLALGVSCDDGSSGILADGDLDSVASPITFTGVISTSSGWTTTGTVATTSLGNYTDPTGTTYPINFRMSPTAGVPATASTTITGLTAKTMYTVAVKMKGNHAAVPPTLSITGGAQIVKAYSYMDPADENLWREHSYIVYTDTASTSLTMMLSVWNNALGATGDFVLPRINAGAPAVPVPETGQAAFVATPARTAMPTAGQNLIADPNWAITGAATPWVYDAWSSLTGSGVTRTLTLAPTAINTARTQQIISTWLAPSTTYTMTVKAGVSAGVATIYATYLDTGATALLHNVTNVSTATTPTLHTFTFTTRSTYSQIKLIFEKYRADPGQAYFQAPAINATGSEWTDTPWVTPPAMTTNFNEVFTSGLSPQKWLIANKQWGGDNGGVHPANVKLVGGNLILEAHGDAYTGSVTNDTGRRTRVGAAVVTRNYYASGLYEVRAKVPSALGACTAFWPFHYINYAAGDTPYWAEPSPIRNTEIDWEMATDQISNPMTGVHSAISFQYQRANNWGGQWGGEGGEDSGRIDHGSSVADGAFHTYGIGWNAGTELGGGLRTAGTVKWYFDGALVYTYTGKTFGQDNVPYRGARFWIGIWFPASGYSALTAPGTTTSYTGWAGNPSFNVAQLEIQWVHITPAASNRDTWVTESNPSGYYAPPTSYP